MHVPNIPIHHTFHYIYLACMWLTVRGKCPIKYSPGAVQMISLLLLNDKKYFLSWCALKLQRRHNGHDGVPNHQPYDCLLNCLFRWGADQGKHRSSASLALVRGIHRWPVNSPHKGPVTRKMFPFDDILMSFVGVKVLKPIHANVRHFSQFLSYNVYL